MKLYEIDAEIASCIDENGEIIDFEKFESLSIEKDRKIEGLALHIKNLSSFISEMKAEKATLEDRQASKEKELEKAKEYLSFILAGSTFESAKVKIGFRRSQKIEYIDEVKAFAYAKEKGLNVFAVKEELSKSAITDLIKSGAEIPGVTLVEKNNIQIK